MPQFVMLKPPYSRVNPYDEKNVIPSTVVPYPGNQIDFGSLKKWVLDNIPDYSKHLHTSEDFDQF
jgi:hypothetical protein